jgi:hypothetical protein
MTTGRHVNALKAAMQGMKQDPTAAVPAATVVALPTSSAPQPGTPSRTGKRQIAGHFDPLVGKQLRFLANETDRSVQQLLEEALNDLFRKHGKSAIAG